MALLTRGKRFSSTHQNAGTILSHQEDYGSHWTNLTTGNRSKKNYYPSAKGQETSNTVNYTKREDRNILQAVEQDKNPQEQINEEEIGKLPEKKNSE